MMRGRTSAPAPVAWALVLSLLGGCAWIGVETPNSLMKEGQQLYLDKKYDEAITTFERVIELDSTRRLAYVSLARCYMAKGSWTLAVTNGRLAYEAQPAGEDVLTTFTEALLGGGAAALRTGQFTKAIADYTEYIGLHGTDARGYLGAAEAYAGVGRFADAVAAFARGFQNDRGGALRQELLEALLDSGTQALKHGQAKSAIALLQEYVQRDPANAAAYVDLGKALLEAGDRSDALRVFTRALQLNPGEREAQDLMRGLD